MALHWNRQLLLCMGANLNVFLCFFSVKEGPDTVGSSAHGDSLFAQSPL